MFEHLEDVDKVTKIVKLLVAEQRQDDISTFHKEVHIWM